MRVIGLTGSIGAGKSTVVKLLRERGIAVHDADEAVHRLYLDQKIINWMALHFPEAVVKTKLDRLVDRKILAGIIFNDDKQRLKLEAYIHPLVRASADHFLDVARARGEHLAVLDIPLLFETGRDQDVDITVTVSAPYDIRLARALQRPGLTADMFAARDARQLPDADKCARADYVIENSGNREELKQRVDALLFNIA